MTLSAYQDYAAQMPVHWEGYRQNILATLADVKPAEQIVAEQNGMVLGTALLHPAGTMMSAPGGASRRMAVPEVRLLAVVSCGRGEQDAAADAGYLHRLTEQINDDLNTLRAVALTWELVKSDLPTASKKVMLLQFDRVLGLRLAERQPVAAIVPDAIMVLVQQRQQARAERRWQDADAVYEQIRAAGYAIDATPQRPRVRSQQWRQQTRNPQQRLAAPVPSLHQRG